MRDRSSSCWALMLSALLPVLLMMAGCHKAPASVPTPESVEATLRPEADRLAQEAAALSSAQDDLVWKNWTEGAVADIGTTYERKAPLFTPSAISTFQKLIAVTKDPLRQRGLSHLETHFIGEYLAEQLAEVNTALANVEAAATFEVAGKEHPYRALPRLLANEKNTERRRALYAAATPAVERISQSLRRKDQRLRALLGTVGYNTYTDFAVKVREVRAGELAVLAEQILTATQEAYEKTVEQLAQRELQMGRTALTRADLPRLFLPKGVAMHFPKEGLLQKVQKTAAGLGIDLATMKNLRIDSREDPKKNPRALALAVRVPEDVRLSFKPSSGVDEHSDVFHELGHALHAAFTEAMPFELAKLGNPTVDEAFSRLFEDLLEDPVWLTQNSTLPPSQLTPYLATTSALHLHRLREAAGALLYALEAEGMEDAEARSLYAQIYTRVYTVPLRPEDEARYLVDREDFFEPADRLRSAFLAGQLQAQLKARFGPAWWTQSAAGDFLKQLWRFGNARSAEELAQSAGETGVKPDVLLLRLSTTLNVPIRISTPPPATQDEADGGRSDGLDGG